jgi:hypothetical protein
MGTLPGRLRNTKKILLALLILSVILSMRSRSAPAGSATAASGLWRYKPRIEHVRVVDSKAFFDTSAEGVWTGTFIGASTEVGQVVIHSSGIWSFSATVSFSRVTVDRKSGTLELSIVGERPDVSADWQGEWVILSGTGDLATLRGQGTWWAPAVPEAAEWSIAYYGGQVDFET